MRIHLTFENTLNWLKGSHSINIGGLLELQLWQENQQIVPELRFDVDHGRSGRGDVRRGELPGGVGRRTSPTPAGCMPF